MSSNNIRKANLQNHPTTFTYKDIKNLSNFPIAGIYKIENKTNRITAFRNYQQKRYFYSELQRRREKLAKRLHEALGIAGEKRLVRRSGDVGGA